MKKRMSDIIGFLGMKNLIAIVGLFVLVVAISVGIVISNNKSDQKVQDEIEESEGLHVEENADDVEGDSIDFSEFQTEEEKKNDSSNKQDGNKNTQNGNGGQSGSDSGNNGLTETPSDGGDGGSGNGGTTSSGSESFGPLF